MSDINLMQVGSSYTITLETRTGVADAKKPLVFNVEVLEVKDFKPINKVLYKFKLLDTKQEVDYFMVGNTSLSRVSGTESWIKSFSNYKITNKR